MSDEGEEVKAKKDEVVEEPKLNPITSADLSCISIEAVIEIINKITPLEYEDHKDVSLHPSYTNFKFPTPYEINCRRRYIRKTKLYEKQFQRELRLLEKYQQSAYEAARFNRHLCITTLWPPLHNIREINYFQNNFFKKTPKQQKRLNYLLTIPQN